MRIGIVGSREYPNEESVRALVRELQPDTVVVSGGARGVDSWAADEARSMSLEVVEHLADWKQFGRRAGPLRNTTIVNDCDELIAFWDGHSAGTMDTVLKAREAGKPVRIIEP